jgi:hypothetical protein
MIESNKKEITVKEFKEILQHFRISTRFWFLIIQEMEDLYKINSNCKRITLKGEKNV